MTRQLENKLAQLVSYLTDVRAGYRDPDEQGVSSLLDHPDLCQWLEQARREGLQNTMFVTGDPYARATNRR